MPRKGPAAMARLPKTVRFTIDGISIEAGLKVILLGRGRATIFLNIPDNCGVCGERGELGDLTSCDNCGSWFCEVCAGHGHVDSMLDLCRNCNPEPKG